MSLFQKSVLKDYLKFLPKEKVEMAWQTFAAHFHNPIIQENIRASKEEQYQESFLDDLFVKVFGYVKKPNPSYNLTTELKNVKNAKKTDGALLRSDGNPFAVIELKGMDTTDLSKVEAQAFGYKNNQYNCTYVIISNFEKLRFYIDNAVDFEEFNLFTITRERFEVLYFCLSFDTLLIGDKPKKAKEETQNKEEDITKALYNDYADFRNTLFKNIQNLNPEYDKLTLFKKTQKLLDRFLFIFFAEDKGLLDKKLIAKIINEWRDINEVHEIPTKLYDKYKRYFHFLYTGKKSSYHNIFPYNGGLFKTDELLDNLKIDDALLARHTLKISEYDFDSDVSVNILGHIFEHSLNDFEEIQAEIEGKEIEKTNTRRKKDGVFYTPKYITKYIVDNTVGKLCQDKKQELELLEETLEKNYEVENGKPIKNKKIRQELQEKTENYKKWLSELTICDPACGSGAFLNQVLEFLIAEHHYVYELELKLIGTANIDTELENKILKNNIFGVDINEESVEIAKLSLWLRTAYKGRKLTTLNDNIKCGNSLIDDPKIAAEKAFNWQNEFPTVFEKGGFDVVVGNPPYLRIQGLKDAYPELTDFYEKNYQSATGNYDIYVLFIEKSFNLINPKGEVSFILPHKFLISDFGAGIRTFLAENKAVNSLLHFEEHLVFEVTTYTCVLNLNKEQTDTLYFRYINPSEITDGFEWDKMDKKGLHTENWNLMSQTKINLFEKLHAQPYTAKDIFSKIFQGIATSADSIYLIEGEIKGEVVKGYSKSLDKIVEIEKGLVKPMLKGQNVSKYMPPKNTYFVIFPYWLENGKAKEMTEEEIAVQFPKGYLYLKENETELRNREKGRFDNDKEWFLFSRKQGISQVEQQKIITPEISLGTNMTFDEGVMYHNTKCYSFILKNPSLESYTFYLSVLNSALMWFYLMNTGYVLRGGYFAFKTNYLLPFPLPAIPADTKPFINLANQMLSLNEDFSAKKNRFLRRLEENFKLDKLTKKLENFYEFDFSVHKEELKKKKIELSFKQQDEWQDYFEEYKKDLLALQNQIQSTDNQIDNLVFELYGLSEEEIKLIKEA